VTERDLTEKIVAGPLGWTGPINAGRRVERWFQTGLSPVARSWWNTQGPRTQLAVIAATVFALVGMLNLAAGLGSMTSTRTGPGTSTAASTSPAVLTQESAAPDAGKTWAVAGLWQGSGSRDTEVFVVGEHWRVDWVYSPAPTGGLFQVFIYRADGRVLMNLAANNQKGGTDTSFWAGPGRYFLRINSSGGDWKLDVQDLR
jgi:hypothetical protein